LRSLAISLCWWVDSTEGREQIDEEQTGERASREREQAGESKQRRASRGESKQE
jgi:hypothetical protein